MSTWAPPGSTAVIWPLMKCEVNMRPSGWQAMLSRPGARVAITVRERLCRSMAMISPVIEEMVTSRPAASNLAAGGMISPSMNRSGAADPSIETRQISPPIRGKYRRPSGPTAIALGWGRSSSITVGARPSPYTSSNRPPSRFSLTNTRSRWHVMPLAEGRSPAMTRSSPSGSRAHTLPGIVSVMYMVPLESNAVSSGPAIGLPRGTITSWDPSACEIALTRLPRN